MSDVATVLNGSRELAHTGGDPFQSYGAKVGQQGTFLSFKAGEWLFGSDDKVMPLGTRLVANMEGLRIGWVRWFGKKMTDDYTELLTDQRPLQRRESLGDTDPTEWEVDNRGDARDPWSLSNVLQLADDGGETYIYTTSSKGGIGAIGRLCTAYGQQRRQHPGQTPILELGRDSYDHKEWGKTYFPVFTIVGWMDEGEVLAAAGDGDLPFDGDEVAPAAKAAVHVAPAKVAAAVGEALASAATKRTKF